jgi:transcriptional regulator GlxA family with amidase domain
MVAFPGAQVLDITRPCEVLAQARLPNGASAYAVQLVAHEASPLATTSGLKIEVSRSFLDLTPVEREGIDTLPVAGGCGVEQATQDRPRSSARWRQESAAGPSSAKALSCSLRLGSSVAAERRRTGAPCIVVGAIRA